MSNIRYFTAEKEINNCVILKVWCGDNQYHSLFLEKDKLVNAEKNQAGQYCIDLDVLREEIQKSASLILKNPISVKGIFRFQI